MRLSTGFHIEVAIASKDDILRAINKYYDIDDSVEEFLNIAPAQEVREQEKLVEDDSPIVRLVNQILQMAVEQRASDIHIDPRKQRSSFVIASTAFCVQNERCLSICKEC
ncbi:Type II secretion system protein E [Anoxybacillus sp. BCO1]|nr:Type II secretion system protein E [Anoxybacillus sp. BCO1]